MKRMPPDRVTTRSEMLLASILPLVTGNFAAVQEIRGVQEESGLLIDEPLISRLESANIIEPKLSLDV